MKSLVLAEKPSVGRDLAKVLGCKQGGKGYLEGVSYVVTWAMGHLVELADPGAYEARYKSWKLEDLPMMPDSMKFKVIRKTSRQFNLIKTLLKRKDINNIIIATDAGREGELVARLIMKLASWHGPFQRLWISSQTNQAVQEGFNNLKDGKTYDNLFKAALSRAEADWIVGLNVTRAMSCRYDVRLSAGRVQSPTINLIALREKEIKDFIPKKYWNVKADFGTFHALWQGKTGRTRIFNKTEALKIKELITGGEGRITELKISKKTVPPPLAYDLTSLQRDANTRLGFSAKKTLSTLQVLYERHKITTYPRTDSKYITRDMVPTLALRLRSLKNTSFRKPAEKLLEHPIQPGKRLVDDKKVTDHHAILPTGEPVIVERLDSDEKKLMNLIMERFVEILSPPVIKESSSVKIDIAGELFTARGERILEKGWSGVKGYRTENSEDEDILIQSKNFPEKGKTIVVKSIEVKEGLTKPPARYTEGTLLGVMENPSKFINDESLKKSISRGGLGTPATRADIIEKIISNNYIERHGKELVPTPRGLELLDLVPAELKSPALTASWELRLSMIEEGKQDPSIFLKGIRKKTAHLVEEIKNSTKKYTPKESAGKKCPVCGRSMVYGKNKRGRKIYICYALSCGYEESAEEQFDLSRHPGKKERVMNRKLISKYSDKSGTTSSFADLIQASRERRKR